MRRLATVVLVVLLAMILASSALAAIHPIVESIECANANAFANHPLGDVADPPGQTPGGSENPNANFKGVSSANANAAGAHKLDGMCGKVGQP